MALAKANPQFEKKWMKPHIRDRLTVQLGWSPRSLTSWCTDDARGATRLTASAKGYRMGSREGG